MFSLQFVRGDLKKSVSLGLLQSPILYAELRAGSARKSSGIWEHHAREVSSLIF
jgi:hypothetical protein